CTTNADCMTPPAPVCDAMARTCRACQLDAECAPSVCDVGTDSQHGQCVQCNTDANCGANQKCADHTCAPVTPTPSGSSGNGGGGAGGHFDVGNTGGCGCRTAPEDERAGALWLAVGLFATAAARRRRR